ncbi:MAG: hypothetical protein K8I00_04580, partial [Candidatus Omnitrophica bacterium]|nr:hypothetical protein [Candidatus Omnitrophota bacterium]
MRDLLQAVRSGGGDFNLGDYVTTSLGGQRKTEDVQKLLDFIQTGEFKSGEQGIAGLNASGYDDLLAEVKSDVETDVRIRGHLNLGSSVSADQFDRAVEAAGGDLSRVARIMGAGTVSLAPTTVIPRGEEYRATITDGSYSYNAQGRLQFLVSMKGKFIDFNPATGKATMFDASGPAFNLVKDKAMREYVVKNGVESMISRLRASGNGAMADRLRGILDGILNAKDAEGNPLPVNFLPLATFINNDIPGLLGADTKEADRLAFQKGFAEGLTNELSIFLNRVLTRAEGTPENAVDTFQQQIVATESFVYTQDNIFKYGSTLQDVYGMSSPEDGVIFRVSNMIIRTERGRAPQFFGIGATPEFEYKGPLNAMTVALLAGAGIIQTVELSAHADIRGIIRNNVLGSDAAAMPLTTVLTAITSGSITDPTGGVKKYAGTT